MLPTSASGQQGSDLAAYSAATIIRAELPSTAQRGETELERHYAAIHTLEFKPVHFSGDGFVKSNVIARVLQTEVEHVQKGDNALTAITPANYKFSYKGVSQVEGRDVHIYQLEAADQASRTLQGPHFPGRHDGKPCTHRGQNR